MGISAAERNRRKRERKKKAKLQQQQQEAENATADNTNATTTQIIKSEDTDASPMVVEIDYVPEEIPVDAMAVANDELLSMMKNYQESVTAAMENTKKADNQQPQETTATNTLEYDNDYDSDTDHNSSSLMMSKRQIRNRLRPTVAALKKRVARPDLVEAHDPTATDPDFLIQLKAVPGTVPVPRHWGRKRKYLQGKIGFERRPFQLPDFIVATGITELRDTLNEKEADQSAKQKNRSRVAPKMGAMDVDYRTLHDAFFKYQTKPTDLTSMGDVYYEGKELHIDASKKHVGANLSDKLRQALGMTSETSPPPWLWNMQRYGPPPTYPNAKIPGLTAPLPTPECAYGFHPGGWGKPPLDPYGRPLYGGNPLDPPGTTTTTNNKTGANNKLAVETLVTSDGKMLQKNALWGALPTGVVEEDDEDNEESSSSSEEEEESDDDMQDSDDEEAEQEVATDSGGVASMLPPPPPPPVMNLRKDAGDETPAPPKALYQVLDEQRAPQQQQQGTAVFQSQVTYQVPGGAESVLQKAAPDTTSAKNSNAKGEDEDDEDDLGKNFKF